VRKTVSSTYKKEKEKEKEVLERLKMRVEEQKIKMNQEIEEYMEQLKARAVLQIQANLAKIVIPKGTPSQRGGKTRRLRRKH
jgi:hypothetical protein